LGAGGGGGRKSKKEEKFSVRNKLNSFLAKGLYFLLIMFDREANGTHEAVLPQTILVFSKKNTPNGNSCEF
jgi:hypothetical protein